MKLNAKLNMNGDAASTFKKEGGEIYRTCQSFLDEMIGQASCLHGRNYQHLETEAARDARQADLDVLWAAINATRNLQEMALEMHKEGDV